MLEHPDYYDDARLEEEYAEWLDEFCKCHPSLDDCDYLSFEDWLQEKEYECLDEEEYA